MADKHRKTQLLLPGAEYNGIDFVEIANEAQTSLRVHFLNGLDLTSSVTTASVTITGGEKIRKVDINPIGISNWEMVRGHAVLNLSVVVPGDFSNYTLSIDSEKIDNFFASSTFSFKARCPSNIDCRETSPPCPPNETNVPPIDYMAKDFLSFRQALLDFSALRYPNWQERSEADFGVMFLEALSALADDLSYTQDRIAAEAALETATQRRSIVRHARMVDYEPRPATASRVMLQFDVADGTTSIAHGLPVSASGPDGTPIVFETGEGLLNRLIDLKTGKRLSPPPSSIANPMWNRNKIEPYWLDDSQRCLKAGATEMLVLGHGYGFQRGQYLLIETRAESSADPPIRQIVRLIDTEDPRQDCDKLFLRDANRLAPPFKTCETSPPQAKAPTAFTRIRWRGTDKLKIDRDLTRTRLSGNIVRATHGFTIKDERFAIVEPPSGDLKTPAAIVRTGSRALPVEGAESPATPQHLYTLLSKSRLTWLSSNPEVAPEPEILLEQIDRDNLKWDWYDHLLKAENFARAFTLDEVRYHPIAPNSDGSIQHEYDGDQGDTIRFGDGIFGEIPDDNSIFSVTYRVGGGANGNVAPDSITRIEPLTGSGIIAVTNPLPATGGADAESPERVRRLAPQKFRAVKYRAVIPKDYQDAAMLLPWVQRAGTVFRWTGSWLTVFTTPDPLHSERITITQRRELIDLLNRYRMAGYESYVPEPQYVSLDLEIIVCAHPDAFRGDVEGAVRARLDSSSVVDGVPGFFNPDNFSFGQPLERSKLESAIQKAPGVAGVICIHYRVRGRVKTLGEMPGQVLVGINQIIRCDNNPSVPEHGSLKIIVKGGK